MHLHGRLDQPVYFVGSAQIQQRLDCLSQVVGYEHWIRLRIQRQFARSFVGVLKVSGVKLFFQNSAIHSSPRIFGQ